MTPTELLDRLLRKQPVRDELCEGLDLSKRQFSAKCDLAGVVLVNPNLREVSLPQVDLTNAVLRGQADLGKAKLHGATLDGVRIEQGQLSHIELVGASVTDAQLAGNFDTAVLTNAHGRNLTFTGATLYDADFDGARLPSANFRGLQMDRAHANGANLAGADFGGASLVQFRATRAAPAGEPADLSGVNFASADLTNATLDEATVNETTDFSGARLHGASLRGLALARAVVMRAEVDVSTYHKSNWSPDDLALLIGKGLRRPADLEAFPTDARRMVEANGPILVVTFEGPVTGWDGHIVSTLAFACLDVDLPNLNAEPLVLKDGPSLWVTGLDRAQLAALAEAFVSLAWRKWANDRTKPKQRTIAAMFVQIEALRARCVQMVLRDDPRTTSGRAPRIWKRTELDMVRTTAGRAREPWSRSDKIALWSLIVAALAIVFPFIEKSNPETPTSSTSTGADGTKTPSSAGTGADEVVTEPGTIGAVRRP